MNVAMYLRKSRAEENSDPIQTLARHKKILTEYSVKNNLLIIKIYEEGVMSGDSLMTRPEMQHLLSDVSNGEYDAVLCMDIDRLGRGDMQDQGLILNTFKYSDTLIITPDKTYNLNDDTDEELTEFKTFFARRELKTITKRLQRGLKQTIREGGYVANPPFGYSKVYKNKKPTLDIVESEAYFVRMMYNMYLDGNGAQIISDELNRLGAKPRRSDKFNRNTVRSILKNPVYAGKIVWDKYKYYKKGTHNVDYHKRYYNKEDKWIIVEGMHQPIISEDIFNRAQQIRKSKSIPSRSKGCIKLTNPLAGVIVCGVCGHKMQKRNMKGVSYLLCFEPGCCKSAKFSDVEKEILDYLKEFLKEFEVKCKSLKKEDTDILINQLSCEKSKLNTLNKQKNTLHDLLEQGVYDVDTFKERLDILKKEMSQSSDTINTLSAKLEKIDLTSINKLKDNISTLLQIYAYATAQEKNILYKSIFTNITYYHKSLSEPFELILKLNMQQN